MKTVWRLVITHKEDKEARQATLEWSVGRRRVAVGWGDIGNVQGYTTPQAIADAIQQAYPGDHPNNWRNGGASLYDFCYRMKPGDLVILTTGKGGQRELVMEVTGAYEHVEGPEREYRNQRTARIVDIDPNELWSVAGKDRLPGQSPYLTLAQCAEYVSEDTLASIPHSEGVRFD